MSTVPLQLFSAQRGSPALALEFLPLCICLMTLQPGAWVLVGSNHCAGDTNTKVGTWGWKLPWKELEMVGGTREQNKGRRKVARAGRNGELGRRGGEALERVMEEAEMRSKRPGSKAWAALPCSFIESPFRFIQTWKQCRAAFSLFFMAGSHSCKKKMTPSQGYAWRPLLQMCNTHFFSKVCVS